MGTLLGALSPLGLVIVLAWLEVLSNGVEDEERRLVLLFITLCSKDMAKDVVREK